MKPLFFEPSPRLRTKYFLILTIWGAVAVVSTLLFAWLIAVDAGAESPAALAIIAGVLGNALWIAPFGLLIAPYCRSLHYEIHEDEVIVRVGVITRSVKHVPFRTVTNLEVRRGPFDRIFGLGTLKIQTAGMSGQQGAEESLEGLPNVQDVYERVAVALRRYRGALAADAASEDVEPPRLEAGREDFEERQLALLERLLAARPVAYPLEPLPPQSVTVQVDYGELKPLLELVVRELRVIRQNIEL